jgi:hypothetical protein
VVDAGLLGEYSGSSGWFNGGFQVRGLLTLGIISAYVSAPCLFDSDAHGFQPQGPPRRAWDRCAMSSVGL